MVDLEAIRARLRAVSAVSAPRQSTETRNPLILRGVSAVSVVSAESVKPESETGPEGQQGEGADLPGQKGSRGSLYLTETTETTETPHNSAVSDVSALSRRTEATETEQTPTPAESAPEPAPRFRAWRVRRPDGSSGGVVMDPRGMDHAEALAAVDRWPGMTVEPLPRSRVS